MAKTSIRTTIASPLSAKPSFAALSWTSPTDTPRGQEQEGAFPSLDYHHNSPNRLHPPRSHRMDTASVQLRCRADLPRAAPRALHVLAYFRHRSFRRQRNGSRVHVALAAALAAEYPQQLIFAHQISECDGTGHFFVGRRGGGVVGEGTAGTNSYCALAPCRRASNRASLNSVFATTLA